MKNPISIVTLFVFTLSFLSGIAYAKEIALVTEVSGNVKCSFNMNDWNVLLGESLPVGAKVTVGEGSSSLSLIHLALNQELQIPAGAKITITAEKVESTIDLKTVAAIEGLPASLPIELASLQQLGAIDPGRFSGAQSAADASMESQCNESNGDSAGPSNNDGQSSSCANGNSNGSGNFGGSEEGVDYLPTSGGSSGHPSNKNPSSAPSPAPANDRDQTSGGGPRGPTQKTKTFELRYAIPSEVLIKKFGKAGAFSIQYGAQDTPPVEANARPVENTWTVLNATIPVSLPSIHLKLFAIAHASSSNLKSQRYLPITISGDEISGRSLVLQALTLEARGLIGQAAYIWLNLLPKGTTNARTTIMNHLERLTGKFEPGNK